MNKCCYCGRFTKLVLGAGLDSCPRCEDETDAIVGYFREEALMSPEFDEPEEVFE